MNKSSAIKIGLTVLVMGGGLAYLLFSSMGDSMVYYKTVEELLAQRERLEGTTIRVNGLLVPDSIRKKPGTDEFRFEMSKNGQTIEVRYSGILPGTMEPDREMVVQGVLNPGEDHFSATEILTKCPSKYENVAKDKGGA